MISAGFTAVRMATNHQKNMKCLRIVRYTAEVSGGITYKLLVFMNYATVIAHTLETWEWGWGRVDSL
jgi:hypothetical protein